MSISEAVERLKKYFSLDEKKRKEKEEKLEKIIAKLTSKKKELRKAIKKSKSKEEKEVLHIEYEATVKLLEKAKLFI